MTKLRRIMALVLALCLFSGIGGEFSGLSAALAQTTNDIGGFLALDGGVSAAETDGKWKYAVLTGSGYAMITGYVGRCPEKLTVPNNLGGFEVAAIGDGAFAGQASLKRLKIPGKVLYIADSAFAGADGLTIAAYNASEAMRFAKAKSINLENLSTLYFTENAMDFSDIEKSHYKYLNNSTLRLNALEAARLCVGDIFYMPPDKKYKLGEAFEVTSVVDNGKTRLVGITKASPERVITRIVVDEENMLPDYDNMILAEGVTLVDMGNAQDKVAYEYNRKGSATLKVELVDKKFGDASSFSIDGVVTVSIGLSSKIDINVFPFAIKTVDVSVTNSSSVSVKVEGKCEKEILIGKIPFATAGVVSAYVNVYFVVGISGEIEIKAGVEYTAGIKYENGAIQPYTEIKPMTPEIGAAVEVKAGIKPSISLDVAIAGRLIELSATAGIKGKLSVNISEKTTKVTISLFVKAGAEVGLLESKKFKVGQSWDREFILKVLEFRDEQASVGTPQTVVPPTNKLPVVSFYTGTGQKIASQSVKVGEIVTKPADPKRSGYTFTGWFRDKNGQTAWDFAANTVSGSMTLYAGWARDGEIEVPVNNNPNSSSNATVSIYYNTFYDYNNEVGGGWVIIISGCDENAENLFIPTEIKGMTVKAIAANAFKGNANLKYVSIPDSVVSIGRSAFDGCTNLQSLQFSDNVTAIGEAAFNGCINMTNINIPYGVTEINDKTFNGCSSLISISIPGTVIRIGYEAFNNCVSLRNVRIADGVKSIRNSAFSGCISLEDISLPNSVTSIGSYAFRACSSMKNATIGNNVETMDMQVFMGCTMLRDVIVRDGEHTTTNLGKYIFEECINLENVTLGTSVASIPDGTFSCFYNSKTDFTKSCPGLVSINMSNRVTSIGANAFYGCTRLKNINIPDSVTEIGNNAFYACKSLEYIRIPSGVKKIKGLFLNCIGLKNIDLPDTITEITDRCFGGCISLENFTIPDGVINIDTKTFYYCTSLKNIVFGESVKKIYSNAFEGCQSLKSMIIPEGIISMGEYVFSNCSNLSSIYLPKSLQDIDSYILKDCPNLKTLYCVKDSKVDKYYLTDFQKIYVNQGAVKVTFHSLYGGSSVSYAYPSDKLDLLPNPVCEGYLFLGWFIDATCKTPWNFNSDTVSDEPLNLYAKWIIDPEYGFTTLSSTNGAIITGYSGNQSNIIIPNVFRGIPVIGVASEAFSYGTRTVALPASIRDIEEGAFKNTSTLTAITVDEQNMHYKAIDGVLYTANGDTLVCYPASKGDSDFTVPSEVKNIAAYAFEGASPKTLVLPSSLEVIGKGAFRDCVSISSLNLPASLQTIGDFAFQGCADDFALFGPVGTNAISKYAAANLIDYNLYTVTFADGEEEIISVTRTAGETFGDPLADGSGYTYSGWQTANGDKWDFDADVMPQADLTLYVINLARDSYTLSFDSQKGSPIPSITLAAGASIAKPSDPLRDNYTFVGWLDKDGAAWDFGTGVMPAREMTLYAKWAKIDETIPDIPFTWEVNGSEIVITGFLGGVWDAEIPSSIIGLPVTGIADYAFSNDTILDNITIPASVTKIGARAFAGSRVSGVTMTDAVSSIGEAAFQDCASLSKITLSGGCAILPANLFDGCTALIGLTIPEGVVTLGEYALQSCAYLESVELPGTLQTVSKGAFANCGRLKTVTLPAAVQTVSPSAFDGCDALTAINIASGAKGLGTSDGVLMDGSTILRFPSGRTGQYTIPSSVTAVGEGAFQGSALTSLAIPAGVANFGLGAFRDSLYLESVNWAATSTAAIPGEMFANCMSLKSFTVPGGIETIGADAFSNCRGLAQIHIPDCVTTIKRDALPNVASLVVYAASGSAAESYAIDNGLRFVAEGETPVTGIALNKQTLRLIPGNSERLEAILTPASTRETNVVWTSSRESVATVDQAGTVTGAHYGTATITATAANGNTASCEVTIKDADVPVERIELTMDIEKLPVQYSGLITAYVYPENATNRTVIWTSSDESVVTVNEMGMLAAISNGAATVTATASDGSGISAHCAVQVVDGFVLGDVTGDGKVNAYDAVKLLIWIRDAIKLETLDRICADYNGDGKVNQADAQGVINALAGMA